MSKKTWISLVLDETIPDQTIFELIRGSRSLVVPKHLRKASEPHYWIVPVNLKYYDIGEEFSANIANQGYRDEESIKELMRIKPLYSFNDSDFDSERLKCFGIKTVLGPQHMTDDLVQALSPYLKGK